MTNRFQVWKSVIVSLQYRIQAHMISVRSCYANVTIENLFGTLSSEWLHLSAQQ